VIDYLIFKE